METGAPPSIFLHVQTVYAKMMSKARHERIDDEKTGMVYSGHLTKLITGPPINLPIPYYTQIRGALIGMGCAQQLKRGGGSSPSRWALFEEPTLERFKKWQKASELSSEKPTSKTSQNERMIRDLSTRLESVEEALQDLIASLQEGEEEEVA